MTKSSIEMDHAIPCMLSQLYMKKSNYHFQPQAVNNKVSKMKYPSTINTASSLLLQEDRIGQIHKQLPNLTPKKMKQACPASKLSTL